MSDKDTFEEEVRPSGPVSATADGETPVQLILDLEGYEGPLDALLGMARDQKVDLVHISILALANQYLSFVERARNMHLEIAADYLVMAAWLAYLKSRLLLPHAEEDEEPSGPELAAALKFHLRRYEAMRGAGAQLFERPQLGKGFFKRGAPEGIRNIRKTVYEASLYELLKAYGDQQRRQVDQTLHIARTEVYSIQDAVDRLNRLLGTSLDWLTLAAFLPDTANNPEAIRSALALTLAASLEMAKQGRINLRQEKAFAPIYLQKGEKWDADIEQETNDNNEGWP